MQWNCVSALIPGELNTDLFDICLYVSFLFLNQIKIHSLALIQKTKQKAPFREPVLAIFLNWLVITPEIPG